MKSQTYNSISIAFASLACLAILLVLRELPDNDSVHGNYINMIMVLAQPIPETGQEMRATSMFSVTEARIVSVLFIGSVLFSLSSIVFGLLAQKRREHPIGYAGPITLSALVLVAAFQYRWVFDW